MDLLAHEYGWLREYILDQPYSAIEELVYTIKVRAYTELVQQYNMRVLSSGQADARRIEEFLDAHKPTRSADSEATADFDTTGRIPGLAFKEM